MQARSATPDELDGLVDGELGSEMPVVLTGESVET